MTTDTSQAAFRVTADRWKNLPKMTEHCGDGYIGDVYENPEGSAMCSGYFELRPARLARAWRCAGSR
jgi:hypothetical protein